MQWHSAERVAGGIFSPPKSFVIALAGRAAGNLSGHPVSGLPVLDPVVKAIERKLRGRHGRPGVLLCF